MSVKSASNNQGCPLPTMTFSEISRYLQNGYEATIQRALNEHVSICPSCQQIILRIKQMQKTGRELLRTITTEPPEDESQHITTAQLAAFRDKGLPESEHQKIAAHLGECHQCYYKYSLLERELQESGLQTPPEISEVMQEKTTPPLIKARQLKNRLEAFFHSFWKLRWPAPALAFALGVLVMLLINPPGKDYITQIPLIKMSQSAPSSSHILSGSPVEKSPATTQHLLEIPYHKKSKITFNWQAVAGSKGYIIEIYDNENTLLKKLTDISQPTFTVPGNYFKVNTAYTLLVKAHFGQQGLGVVAKLKFRFIN